MLTTYNKHDTTQTNGQKTGLYIGTMSGTSADGLDIVIANISDINKIELCFNYFIEYPRSISSEIKRLQLATINQDENHQQALSLLDDQLTKFYAEHILLALDASKLPKQDIIAIGNHGQTILHQPNNVNPFTLQICDGQKLSNLCNIPVIADFRSADIRHGGQGAPLLPALHAKVFHQHSPCAIVNIGGIANTTLLTDQSTIGFDNGPGNTLMNAWIQKHTQKSFDDNGEWARSGKINKTLLNKLLNDPYFSLTAPKSTGQDYFNLEWLNAKLGDMSINNEDIQATLCELTAVSIIKDITNLNTKCSHIYICGGGAKNVFLMERLQKRAMTLKVKSSADVGVDPDWIEALGFAWLAFCHTSGIEGNVPSVTGARKEVVLGELFSPANQ